MPEYNKTHIIVATIGLAGVIASAVLANYDKLFNGKGKSSATFTPTITITPGQKMYFKMGAMTCRDFESINYYSYLSARGNNNKIATLQNNGVCDYSKIAKVEVDVLEVDGHYIKFKGTYIDPKLTFWIRDDDLYPN